MVGNGCGEHRGLNQKINSRHHAMAIRLNFFGLQNYLIFLFLRCFIFVQVSEQKLWFGRDYFGRRSLLWHLPSNPHDVLAIASVNERNSVAAGTDLVSIFLCFLKVKCTCRTKVNFFRFQKLEFCIQTARLYNKAFFALAFLACIPSQCLSLCLFTSYSDFNQLS